MQTKLQAQIKKLTLRGEGFASGICKTCARYKTKQQIQVKIKMNMIIFHFTWQVFFDKSDLKILKAILYTSLQHWLGDPEFFWKDV